MNNPPIPKYYILQDNDETDEQVVEKQWQGFEAEYKETAQETHGTEHLPPTKDALHHHLLGSTSKVLSDNRHT